MFDLLEIRTLGQLQIQWRTAATPLALAPREAMLLIYLAHQQLPLSRHALYDMLWPDETRPRAQGNLRKLLMDLRRSLGDLIVADRNIVTLQDNAHTIWLDVHKFKWHMGSLLQVNRTQQPAAAHVPKLIEGVKLYRGDFLADFKAPRSYLLSAWVEQEQESLRAQMGMALRALVTHFIGCTEYHHAVSYAQQLLQIDPFDEQMVGELMQLWTQLGEREQALSLYRSYRQQLRRVEKGKPIAALEQLYQEIRSGIVPLPIPIEQPVLSDYSPLPNQITVQEAPKGTPLLYTNQNLPLPKPLTPLQGRDEWLDKLQLTLQDPHVRLVNLVGMGGIGKSHLAITFGNQLASQATMDVAFVALEHLQAPLAATATTERTQQLARAIADVFTHSMALDGFTIGQLLALLHNRDLLLILDYFDPFVADRVFLSDLLQHATRLKILITARESLQLPGEVVLRLPGLSTVSAADVPTHRHFVDRRPTAGLSATPSPAAQLFLQYAQRRHPTLALLHEIAQPGVMQQIEQIGRLVEGHPLAIELAAELVPHYEYREIVDLLSEGIEGLTVSGGQTRRHQSLQLLFAEAWQQLPPDAQILLQQLTVFAEGFSRKAAVAVAGASLELLSLLVNRSWLLGQKAGRYRMPRLLHHYLCHHAPISQDAEQRQQLQARHADYYLGHFLQEIEANSAAAQGKVQFVFVEDGGNIAEAFDWARQSGEPQRQAVCHRLLPLLERSQLLQHQRH